MVMNIEFLHEIYDCLPPDQQQELIDYAESLLQKSPKFQSKKLTFSWAGALRDIRDQYTSLELQKLSME